MSSPVKRTVSGNKKVTFSGLTVMVTGGAGFIGSHTAEVLLRRGDKVIVVDNFNDYYDVKIKESAVKLLEV